MRNALQRPTGWAHSSQESVTCTADFLFRRCVLPVITVDFPAQAPKKRDISVSLGYRGGMTKKITTMRPVSRSVHFEVRRFGSLRRGARVWRFPRNCGTRRRKRGRSSAGGPIGGPWFGLHSAQARQGSEDDAHHERGSSWALHSERSGSRDAGAVRKTRSRN